MEVAVKTDVNISCLESELVQGLDWSCWFLLEMVELG